MATASSPPPDSDHSLHSSPETLTSLPKKPHPLPWTPQETVNLIQAYKEKWYSLNRGQLKASQWEEVAIAVAARCGFDDLSKSSTQCRHKIEKLRKRYRAERLKPYPNSWQFFDLMDNLERGPLPIAAHPVAMVKYQNPNYDANRYEEDSDNEAANAAGYGSVDLKKNKSKSINHIVSGEMNGTRNMNKRRIPMHEFRKGNFANEPSDDEGEDEEVDEDGIEVEEEDGGDGDSELAAEIRGFAERFMRMEKRKIEMMRDTGRFRIEMQKKMLDMILETQRKIADSVTRILEPNKRVKMEL
ncbi:PREDICTED: trihelix transcription factor ASIL2 [Ipomoea nil]|uniref:trihelix transcription factor ASIL2 n=1 Tax=Ipomoea nil TaxID=35883 RepID=UPI00090130DA|nr:PREDICTED: trihelix transcription factor ASIL2 [Ipomoea nil]